MISVIVPTKNSVDTVARCIRSVRDCNYPNMEIIVVDGGSSDGTAEVVESMGVLVITGFGRSRASDCNIAIKHARGEIVAFTDSDCIVDKQWLWKLEEMFADVNVGVAGGPDLTRPENLTKVSLAEGLIHSFYRGLASKDDTDALIGCNSAYRTSRLLQVGGFNSQLPGAEDTELNSRMVRAGNIIRTDVNCRVFKLRNYTYSSLARKYWRYGKEIGIVERHFHSFTTRRRVQFYSLLAGIIGVALVSLYYPLFLPITFAAYVTVCLGLYLHLSRVSGFRPGALIFLLSSTICLVGFLLGFAKGRFVLRLPPQPELMNNANRG